MHLDFGIYSRTQYAVAALCTPVDECKRETICYIPVTCRSFNALPVTVVSPVNVQQSYETTSLPIFRSPFQVQIFVTTLSTDPKPPSLITFANINININNTQSGSSI